MPSKKKPGNHSRIRRLPKNSAYQIVSANCGEDDELFGDFQEYPSDKLRDKGIYYVVGEINSGDLLDIHQDLLAKHLDPNWTDSVQIFINSTGGNYSEFMSLITLINNIKMDVRTFAMGEVASGGSMLLASGTERLVSDSCLIMVHGASYPYLDGTKEDIVAGVKGVNQTAETIMNFWLENSKFKTRRAVQKYLLNGRDVWITPQKALEYGIVDKIVSTRRRKPIEKNEEE